MYKCPVCEQNIDEGKSNNAAGSSRINCPVCGYFIITGNSEWFLKTSLEKLKVTNKILSGILRNRFERGIENILTINNLEEIVNSEVIPKDPLDKIEHIFIALYNGINEEGNIKFNISNNLNMVYCNNEAFKKYFDILVGQELVGYNSEHIIPTIPTFKGYEKFEKLKAQKPQTNRAFVAMRFSDEYNEMYKNGIEEALEECGYEKPFRVDMKEHNGKIDDEIISMINQSSLLIADFSEDRGGIYFEAGYAMGRKTPVIFTCKEGNTDNLHFDTRQYNHIVWKTPEDLKEQLINRIKATVQI